MGLDVCDWSAVGAALSTRDPQPAASAGPGTPAAGALLRATRDPDACTAPRARVAEEPAFSPTLGLFSPTFATTRCRARVVGAMAHRRPARRGEPQTNLPAYPAPPARR